MIGRLKPGATLEQAQAQIDAINAANLERFPQFKEMLTNVRFHTRVVPLQDEVVEPIRKTLYLLWGGAAFVLLIGVINIANLAVARSSVRLRELATRSGPRRRAMADRAPVADGELPGDGGRRGRRVAARLLGTRAAETPADRAHPERAPRSAST